MDAPVYFPCGGCGEGRVNMDPPSPLVEMVAKEPLFGLEVRDVEDVRRINKRLRDMMEYGKTKQDLISMKKRGDLLCAYLFSREAEDLFGPAIDELRRAAMEENAKTSEHGNVVGKRKKWDVRFSAWGTSTYGPRFKPAELLGSKAEEEQQPSP
jgi:hypothetical protein